MAAEGVTGPRVLLANINPGSLRSETVKSIIGALSTGRALSCVIKEAGPYLDRERNVVAAGAQSLRRGTLPGSDALDWDWLLFVDSDIAFDPGHIDTLLAPTLHPDFSPTDTPVLAGLYYSGFPDLVPGSQADSGGGVVDPVVYEWVLRTFEDATDPDEEVWAYRRLSRLHLAELPAYDATWNTVPLEARVAPVCEVGAAGTGFMAIHHSILDTLEAHHALPLPYFDEPVVNGVHLGEDMAFCHRVRTLGYPVLVNRACVVLHHKTMKLA